MVLRHLGIALLLTCLWTVDLVGQVPLPVETAGEVGGLQVTSFPPVDGESAKVPKTPDNAGPAEKGRNWALIIGVNQYAQLSKLACGQRDADRIYEVLTQHCGYEPRHVALITPNARFQSSRPRKHVIESELSNMLSIVSTSDSVLVYFSGHGFRDPATGDGFLAAEDTMKNKLLTTAISVSSVMEKLGKCRAARKLLILDCCRVPPQEEQLDAGEVQQSKVLQAGMTIDETMVRKAKGVIALASCSEDESSYSIPQLRQGLFTHFLARGLEGKADRNGDKFVDVDEIAKFTSYFVPIGAKELREEEQNPKRIDGFFKLEQDRSFPLAKVNSKPYLIRRNVQDKWSRDLTITTTYEHFRGDKSKKLVHTEQDSRNIEVLETVPAKYGRPERLIVRFNEHTKKVSRHRLGWSGIAASASLARKEILYTIDSLGSAHRVHDAPRTWNAPTRGTLHPLLIDEAILPTAKSADRLDTMRLLGILRKLNPHCDPVFLDDPLVKITKDRNISEIVGSAVISAKIGPRGKQTRMEFTIDFKVEYSHDLQAVTQATCTAVSDNVTRPDLSEHLTMTIKLDLKNHIQSGGTVTVDSADLIPLSRISQ